MAYDTFEDVCDDAKARGATFANSVDPAGMGQVVEVGGLVPQA